MLNVIILFPINEKLKTDCQEIYSAHVVLINFQKHWWVYFEPLDILQNQWSEMLHKPQRIKLFWVTHMESHSYCFQLIIRDFNNMSPRIETTALVKKKKKADFIRTFTVNCHELKTLDVYVEYIKHKKTQLRYVITTVYWS